MQASKLVLIGLAAASIGAATVLAQSGTDAPVTGPHHRMKHGGRLVGIMMRHGDLTPDQKEQAHQILAANRADAQDIRDQLHQAKDELASMVLGPQDVEADAVSTRVARIAELKQQLAQRQAATALAIRAILTPDQLAKAAAAKDQMPDHHKGPCTGKSPGTANPA